jgi:hypothetical protein
MSAMTSWKILGALILVGALTSPVHAAVAVSTPPISGKADMTFRCLVTNIGARSMSFTMRLLAQDGVDSIPPQIGTLGAGATTSVGETVAADKTRRCVISVNTPKSNVRDPALAGRRQRHRHLGGGALSEGAISGSGRLRSAPARAGEG